MILIGETEELIEEPVSVSLCHHKSYMNCHGHGPGLHGENLATNHPSCGTAVYALEINRSGHNSQSCKFALDSSDCHSIPLFHVAVGSGF